MRQKQEYRGRRASGGAVYDVCLFGNYALWDAKASSFALGQVIRMKCNGKDFKQPVNSTENTSSEVEITVKLYVASGQYYMPSNET